jgi:hypothetical protein
MKWLLVLLVSCVWAAHITAVGPPPPKRDYIKVEVRGKLDFETVYYSDGTKAKRFLLRVRHHRIASWSGRPDVWRLDPRPESPLHAKAEKLVGKSVRVTGDMDLILSVGVQRREDFAVRVRTLEQDD